MSKTPRTTKLIEELKITEQSRHGHKLFKLCEWAKKLEEEVKELEAHIERITTERSS